MMERTITTPGTGHETDRVCDMIASHAAAWARFGRAVALVDDDQANKDGRKITAADKAEYEASNDAEETAYHTLLRTPFSDRRARRIKAMWIQLWIGTGNALQSDEVDLLLESLISEGRE